MSLLRYHLDEDCQSAALASALRQHGIEVVTTNEAGIAGADDAAQLEHAARQGAAIVSNPYEGVERWFEPGSELRVVTSAEEAVAAYRELLDDPAQAEEMGRRARERVLDEHTYAHRARQLLSLVGLGAPAAARA